MMAAIRILENGTYRAVSVKNNNPPFSRMRIVLVGRKCSNGNTTVVQYAFSYFQGRYLIA